MKFIQDLTWQSPFTDRFPGDPETRNFTRQVPGAFYSRVAPTPVRAPALLGWSSKLAEELGIGQAHGESLEVLAGNRVLPGMVPYAARYGGHQFGHWAGQLGDGRAITLGATLGQEFQLKGAGPTPYSRRADGRAVLRSSLREFLCSEAMHFLGVPTTRALSLVGTGEIVVRDMFYDGNPQGEPGAIVCRVAPSFLRFGNFEILREEPELLRRLADYVAGDLMKLNLGDADIYGLMLDEIGRRTARLMAEWMRVGFVHGVMNTDNLSVLGLTIDYGPYGWLEPYESDWTPNTTDAENRRYRFGAQPGVGLWNLARLAESVLPLLGDQVERAQTTLEIYRDTFQREYAKGLAAKLGLQELNETNQALWEELLRLFGARETDMTIFFRRLGNWDGTATLSDAVRPAFYSAAGEDASWDAWGARYQERVRAEGRTFEERRTDMHRVNPKYVLRNYLAQNAINAATAGNLSVLERLYRVLQRPYDEQPGEEELAASRPDWARNTPGCSALSCSS